MAMKENLISFLIIIGVLMLVGALWFAYENPALNPRLEDESYTIVRKWEMPEDLNEISGIAYIGENRIACVQDEEGIIYIYNLTKDGVEKKVNFAKAGDYEGIAIVDSSAYVLESNGKLYHVERYMDSTFTASEINTFFTKDNNMESLFFDSENNRLLLAPKNSDPNSEEYKGIYAYDFASKKVADTPVFKIPLDDPILNYKETRTFKGSSQEYFPSEIAIHPKNGNIYILEGKNPRLLIMDSSGKILTLHKLNKKSFHQPEGITFAPDGTLYISNEGKKGTANILEVELKE